MHAVEGEMALTAIGVIQLVGVCKFSEKRAGIFSEGVEENAVNADGEKLERSVFGCNINCPCQDLRRGSQLQRRQPGLARHSEELLEAWWVDNGSERSTTTTSDKMIVHKMEKENKDENSLHERKRAGLYLTSQETLNY